MVWRRAAEAAEVADHAEVAAVEPGVAAEGFEHLVEELASALLLGLVCGVSGAGAGDVAGLCTEGWGGGEEETDRDREGGDEQNDSDHGDHS